MGVVGEWGMCSERGVVGEWEVCSGRCAVGGVQWEVCNGNICRRQEMGKMDRR